MKPYRLQTIERIIKVCRTIHNKILCTMFSSIIFFCFLLRTTSLCYNFEFFLNSITSNFFQCLRALPVNTQLRLGQLKNISSFLFRRFSRFIKTSPKTAPGKYRRRFTLWTRITTEASIKLTSGYTRS